ncbi:MAG: DUF5694 domain-containing protein [Solibacillus sp.]|uniref:DUF5694 domain-containing protein n=1 Tax=Solibacillus sp. TaxID=1909654 RepID=UPI003315837B
MEILLLGTIHLEETTDMVQLNKEARNKFDEEQFEILTDDLAFFQPEQIFVEYPYKMQEQLDAQYKDFSLNGRPLQRNEIYQIGFRLASKLGQKKIYAVDWNEEISGIKGLEAITDEQSVTALQKLLQKTTVKMQTVSSKIQTGNIVEFFKFINTAEQNLQDHQLYVDLMLLQDEVAFEWVANYWYYRNLKIVQNIRKSIEQGTQKAVIIYGAGHNYLLQQMLQDDPQITVTPYGEYTVQEIAHCSKKNL